MDRGQAAFDAFDGLRIALIGGRVVHAPAFTVADASHFIRLLADLHGAMVADADGPWTLDDVHEIHTLMHRTSSEVADRLGLLDAKLVEIGLEVDGVEWGDLTASDLQAMLGILNAACHHPDVGEQAANQMRWLDEATETFGLDPRALSASELFEVGRSIARTYYRHMYGLASDFRSRLHQSPMVKTWTLVGREALTSAAGSPT